MTRLNELLASLARHDGINDKARLAGQIAAQFHLTKDRSVFYCEDFAVRFSSASGTSFSNTVLSLSNLRKVDHVPFLVCLVTRDRNHVFLANSTFLRKVSHSSHDLRVDNIRGSFNGSDIAREFEGIPNIPENIERLFSVHVTLGFEKNLVRLVEATNGISPKGSKFHVTDSARRVILEAPKRAAEFSTSDSFEVLQRELDDRVQRYRNDIVRAALIENVNVRGRVIEYLIAGHDDALRQEIVSTLRLGSKGKGLPALKTKNTLGDYQRVFEKFLTETDIKTKLTLLSSNPKAYNLDKILEFLASEKSVFMFYFVGVDPERIVNTTLVSMFQVDLLKATLLLKHWAGRNSRGVAQFEGRTVESLIRNPRNQISRSDSEGFLERVMAL